MPDNSVIIEELARAVNRDYDKQQELLNSLMMKLENEQMGGKDSHEIERLTRKINKLSEILTAQYNGANAFYQEMQKRIGEGVRLNENMLKDAYVFRAEYVRLTKELERLKKEYKSKVHQKEENYKPTPIDRFERKQLEKKQKRLKWERSKLRANIKEEYGEHSDAYEDATSFNSNKSQRKKFAQDMNDMAKGHVKTINAMSAGMSEYDEKLKEANDRWIAMSHAGNQMLSLIRRSGNLWLKYNAQAISDAKRLGMTSKEEAMGYMESLMENSKTLARNFGMSVEQAMKMQDSYAKVTGRATLLTTAQMEDIAAASRLMGEETVQSAIGMMDSMGTTSQTTMELLDKNFVRAANAGLDTVKASEAFVKNMSLANKLNFRNGVDGISKMTILSQRIKLNLQEVAAVADKFSTIEGALEGSARLQMLGGAGALYGSNPMEMMYEALADPEALYQRMGKMFADQAFFDRRTGESRIDPLQMAIIREQAKAMGTNPDEAIQSAKQQAKLHAIENDFRTFNNAVFNAASPEEKAAIENKAEYNKEKGTWEIKYLNSKGVETVADIRNLDSNQLKEITKDNVDKVEDIRAHVRKIAGELVSTEDRMKSMADQIKTGISQTIHPFMKGFDSIITGLNQSGFWKFLASGTALGSLTAVVGYGLYSGAKLWGQIQIVDRLRKWAGVGSVSRNVGNLGVGANVAVETRRSVVNTNKIAKAKNIANLKNAINKVGKRSVVLAVGTEVITGGLDMISASQTRAYQKKIIEAQEKQINPVTGGKRFNENEKKQQEIIADNESNRGYWSGGGRMAGAIIGGFLGAPLGPWGVAIGAAIGGHLGSGLGKEMSGLTEKNGDIITEHMKEIEKGDAEDNIKKIVLPVESIDYNVSLIAGMLGVLTNKSVFANPARGNVYLAAEAAGIVQPSGFTESKVEGQPLNASPVNEVDSQTVYASQLYQPTGPLTLNINGSIDLNLKGTKIGSFGEKEFLTLLYSSPEMQRQLTDAVLHRMNMNGNGNKTMGGDNWRLNVGTDKDFTTVG